MRFARCAAAWVFLILFVSVGAAQEKSLSWRALDVKARLDNEGRLHLVERHAMVFTGDWNGGERSFRLFPGQQISALQGVRRIDPATGAVIDLRSGNLDEVDRYAFVDGTTLRWRSRLPSDPPFENTQIDYEISYTLSGVLVRRGDTYELDHNFALPAADKAIGALSVDLELDSAWVAPPEFKRHWSASGLPPGANFTVTTELSYSGASAPSGVRTGTTKTTRLTVFLALFAGIGLLGYRFYSRESALGRFGSTVPPESVDETWLQEHVFSLSPEEAGALWDDKVGAPEVTAVLARLTAEDKLETKVSDKEMTLRLKVKRESFDDYEQALIYGLFYGNRHETSTSDIKAHYKSSGFDPAGKIRPGLLKKLSAHADFQDKSAPPTRGLTIILLAAGIALMVLPTLTYDADLGTVLGMVISNAFLFGLGMIGATFYRKRVDGMMPWLVSFAFVPAIFLWGSWQGVVSGNLLPLSVLLGQTLLRLAFVNSLFNAASAREGPKKIARRKELVAARQFFQRELATPAPRMKDAWYPWLIAFGLGPAVDRWFRSFGGTATVERDPSGFSSLGSSTSTSSSSSSQSGSFTGGGGLSGGAGASAGWALAAGAMASGVSAPSSSGSSGSSGGGGGGGGGSSGGGGGGGW